MTLAELKLTLLSLAGRVDGGRVGVATHTGVTAEPLADIVLPLAGPVTAIPYKLLPADPCILTLREAAQAITVKFLSTGCWLLQVNGLTV